MDEKVIMREKPDFVVLISADSEWRVVKKGFRNFEFKTTPFGEWLTYAYKGIRGLERPIVFLHGGWGKVAAAGSTQYAIDQWHPKLIVNLGTCGGFEGLIQRGQIVLAERTVIYDIYEQMGDPAEHIQHYATNLEASWLADPLPQAVIRTVLVSGDRDLFWKDATELRSTYGAIAGDWESGAIAWVAAKNQTSCLILRGVTDLVGEHGGEAYEGRIDVFYENTERIMEDLIEHLPQWLVKYPT